MCSTSQGREREATPLGGGAIPTGNQLNTVPGLSNFNAELNTVGGIASGSYPLSTPACLAPPAPLLGGCLSCAGPSGLGSLSETPLGSVVPTIGTRSFVGGVVVGQSSPRRSGRGSMWTSVCVASPLSGCPRIYSCRGIAAQIQGGQTNCIYRAVGGMLLLISYTSVVAIRAPHLCLRTWQRLS